MPKVGKTHYPYTKKGKAAAAAAKKKQAAKPKTASKSLIPTPDRFVSKRTFPGLEHPIYRKEIHGKLRPKTMPALRGAMSLDDVQELKGSPRRRRR